LETIQAREKLKTTTDHVINSPVTIISRA